jgi:hypothetical protein
MKRKTIWGLLGGSILLSGCVSGFSEAPIATNFPAHKQQKLQAAAHWQVIADDTASQLIKALPERRPLHVQQSSQQSPFEKAFSGQLIGTLTAAGYPVMKTADRPGTLSVDVSATPLRFSKNRKPHNSPGALTLLAGGLWVLHDIYNDVSPGAGMMAAAVAVDATHWLRSEFASGATPQTELIVTASVSNAERYYMQTSSVYYTSDPDVGLYVQGIPATVIPVKGGN